MNDVSVITLDDDKDYVVLEKIDNYLIVFEEDNPQNVLFASYDEESQCLKKVTSKSTLTDLYLAFCERHPEYKTV